MSSEQNRQETLAALEDYEDDALAFKRAMGDSLDPEDEDDAAVIARLTDLGVEDYSEADDVQGRLDEYAPCPSSSIKDAAEVRLIFSTGGPHYELRWTQDGYRAERPWFLSLPWYDRVEVRSIGPGLTWLAEHTAEYVEVSKLSGFDPDYEPEEDDVEEDD